MKLEQYIHTLRDGWVVAPLPTLDSNHTLVYICGSSNYLSRTDVFSCLEGVFPKSILVGCSGGGVFINDELLDDALIVTVIYFENTRLKCHSILNACGCDSGKMGREIAGSLNRSDLKSIMILADGLKTNGEHLLVGIQAQLVDGVVIWGGMAGDGSEFNQNWVYCGRQLSQQGAMGIGFYGNAIEVSTGVGGGWSLLGPRRTITSSAQNQVFTVDNRAILDIYSEFLGSYSCELPAIGARYPLLIEVDDADSHSPRLRSVISVDWKTRSMKFGGDVPQGSTVRMMKGDLRSLVDDAATAAFRTSHPYSSNDCGVTFVCNCIGRRVLLGQHAKLEIEAIRAKLPESMPLAGFYSLGEIASPGKNSRSEFFNETVALTTIVEKYGSPH